MKSNDKLKPQSLKLISYLVLNDCNNHCRDKDFLKIHSYM